MIKLLQTTIAKGFKLRVDIIKTNICLHMKKEKKMQFNEAMNRQTAYLFLLPKLIRALILCERGYKTSNEHFNYLNYTISKTSHVIMRVNLLFSLSNND